MGRIFNKIKRVIAGDGTPRELVIHVKHDKEAGTRTMLISDDIYSNFKILLRHLAEVHGAELEIIED